MTPSPASPTRLRIGLFGGATGPTDGGAGDAVSSLVDAAMAAEAEGFPSFWTSQIFTVDALTALALAGARTSTIELGTAVVPIHPRHPHALAQQALTVNAAVGGRLALGIGLSHQIVVESMWGLSFERPYTYMCQYLDALLPLLHDQAVATEGDMVTVRAQVQLPGAPAPAVLLAALGERMLRLAGERTAGTITWMTGPSTLRDHIVPTITSAAEGAGRPAPRVIAGFAVCVTDDAAAARSSAAETFAVYGQLPSYRAMLDREGAAGPADVAIVGDEKEVAARFEELEAAGVTDLGVAAFGSDEDRARTRAFLRERLT